MRERLHRLRQLRDEARDAERVSVRLAAEHPEPEARPVYQAIANLAARRAERLDRQLSVASTIN